MPEGASEMGKGGDGLQGETREERGRGSQVRVSGPLRSFGFLLRSMEVIKELETGR